MSRKIGYVLVATAAIAVSLVQVSDAQAWGRRNGSHGSWGSNGSWGGSWGSSGGLFRRHGSNGSWGSRGSWGSHGGYYNGCGSHGGSPANGAATPGTAYYGEQGGMRSAASGQQRHEVGYGERTERDTAATAPIVSPGEQESAERSDAPRQESQNPGSQQLPADHPPGQPELNPPSPPAPGGPSPGQPN